MDANLELMEHVYQDADMAILTLEELLRDLKEKDNKIKPVVEDILKGYERYLEEAKTQLLAHGEDPKDTGFMSKMGAEMGVKKEVRADNSDASIADMLIKGISMGSIDMEKKLGLYKESANKEHLKLAKQFFKFQEDNIQALKKFL